VIEAKLRVPHGRIRGEDVVAVHADRRSGHEVTLTYGSQFFYGPTNLFSFKFIRED
jgi:hypothetical protein